MKKFELKQDYIQLNNLLKIMDFVGSGGEAKLLISDGAVCVNNEVEMQIRKKLRKGDVIEFDKHKIEII